MECFTGNWPLLLYSSENILSHEIPSFTEISHSDLALSVAESMLAETEKKITDAFDIFDHESNKTVDVREIGTIVRSLGCCPSEGMYTSCCCVMDNCQLINHLISL